MSVCEFELELISQETEMQNEREREREKFNNTSYSSGPTAHTSIEKNTERTIHKRDFTFLV